MNFISVCSGILGAELAREPLGWHPLWCAEVDRFASRVIKYRRKGLLNLGDFTKAEPPAGTVHVAVGGTPCQAFSEIGERLGLDDPRGNLTLEFARLSARLGARWLVWENVPGVLSCNDGRDFRTVLRVFAECGYLGCYRILDAQHFGLAQQRRRVFFVGYLGDWRPPCAVLFEPEGMQGNPEQSRSPGPPLVNGTRGGVATGFGPNGSSELAHTCMARGPDSQDPTMATMVTHTLGTLKSVNVESCGDLVSHTLGSSRSLDDQAGAFIAFDEAQITNKDNRSNPRPGGPSPTVCAGGRLRLTSSTAIRKLTPLEYERLQGFPDEWTLIPGASDAARYRAVGNAFPVPVMRWIGERIAKVERILEAHR